MNKTANGLLYSLFDFLLLRKGLRYHAQPPLQL